jgi:hypothetical protein
VVVAGRGRLVVALLDGVVEGLVEGVVVGRPDPPGERDVRSGAAADGRPLP